MIPRFYVALTFDDGFIEHYHVALLLRRLGIKATFFIVTHLTKLEGNTLLISKPKFIREINKMGHEIGSHTKTHPDLTTIPLVKVEEEARGSKQLLEGLIGNRVRGFAYPNGAYNATIVNVIARYYEYARGIGMHPLEDPFNEKPENPHRLGGLGFRKPVPIRILRLPIKHVEHRGDKYMGISIVLHKESLSEILALISYLRLLPGGTRFVTQYELFKLLSRKMMPTAKKN